MPFAICNEMYVGWPFERTFAAIRAAGYEGVEIAPFMFREEADPFRLDEVPHHERQTVRELAAEAGLQIVGLHWLFAKTEGYHVTSPDLSVRRMTSDYLIDLAKLCSELGGRVLVLGSPQQRKLLPGIHHDEALEYAADVIRAVMPACADYDVTLAIEPLSPAEDDFLTTAETARKLLDAVDSPRCRLHLDVKAMASESIPIPEIIRSNRDQLVHFHANDPNLLGPGMGSVDFEPIFEALRDIGYQGWISVETFDRSVDAITIAEQSMHYLQKFLS